MTVRTIFNFTLPNGAGVKVDHGRKASGKMELIKVKDLLTIERDATVQTNGGAFYIILLTKTVKELGRDKMVTRNMIERLNPVDFTFLVDFLHRINHQVIKQLQVKCESCKRPYGGAFVPLGEV